MKQHTLLAVLLAASAAALSNARAGEAPVGYTDTPMLPGGKWHVHDPDRPQPRLVKPGAKFSDLAPAPSDAIVLFDGTNLDKWNGPKGKPTWKIEDGFAEVTPKSGSINTKDEFGDFQLHLEFATPAEVKGDSQERGNSGVIIHGRYEVQVLDSYQNRTYADGTVGGLYGQFPPRANVARKPGEWQTYDIIFEAPQWEEGKLVKPAQVTVILNGVVLHHKQALLGYVVHHDLAKYGRPYSGKGPIQLQDHNNPMRFRNIWIRPLGEYDQQ
ncbi:MAG: DUF1080 domain-containing protein [Verrucomicrobia bacterium]|nr:DUF1080 domain-containing protein [Verrucomicrobiota bacterium]